MIWRLIKKATMLLLGGAVLSMLMYFAMYFGQFRYQIFNINPDKAVNLSSTPLSNTQTQVDIFTADIQAVLMPNDELNGYFIEQYINNQRTLNGLGELRHNTMLANSAQQKLADMITNKYWGHISPSGRNPWDFFMDQKYNYSAAGENLAKGYFTSEQQIVDDWMNSPTHREVILNNKFCDIGVSVQKVRIFEHDKNIFLVVMHVGSKRTSTIDICAQQK